MVALPKIRYIDNWVQLYLTLRRWTYAKWDQA